MRTYQAIRRFNELDHPKRTAQKHEWTVADDLGILVTGSPSFSDNFDGRMTAVRVAQLMNAAAEQARREMQAAAKEWLGL